MQRIEDRIKECLKCGHRWLSVVEHPQKCPNPKCQSNDWDQA